MPCVECGSENRDGARFCRGCGTALALVCSGCGAGLPADSRFCDACGTPVSAPDVRPITASPQGIPSASKRDPRHYTPAHLADKILTSRSAIEGERKQITVLFADIQSSTSIAEEIDPEEWHAILDRFFRILTRGVHRFEGTVNQFTGDGIMALFGAPIAHEDHAQRACYAALLLQRGLRRYSQQLKRERGIAFSVRMGINSGDVVVGQIGDDLRMDYTAQGLTVNLASRIEELASPDTAYLTAHTADLVRGFFELEDLGLYNLKGVRDPVQVHELRGLGKLRTRLDRSRSRGFSRFVGRDPDMAMLEESLARAIAGEGQVVGISAEAGTGKSRLCFEFLEACRARDIAVQETRCVSHGRNIPYLPVLELLRGYFDIKDDDADETARDKIAGRIVRLDPRLTEELPHLFEFLGVPDPHRPAPPLNAEVRERRIFTIVARLMDARSEQRPAVILIEDLHWIDGATQSFVDSLIETVRDTRTLLLLNFRPEYRASFPGAAHYKELGLLPLPATAIEQLLADLLGTHPSLAGLPARIRARTEGNPFFIEELIQSLVEGGTLEGTRGEYRLVRPIERVEIPPSVRGVLAGRIDRLSEREKNVLQIAAVIGKTFAEPALRLVAEESSDSLAATLRSLIRSEFVFEESLYPESEYSFKHPLTQEVAYHSQLAAGRRAIHAAVARATETLSGDRLDEQSALIAHHWERAGEDLEAARWHRRAALWAGYNHLSEAVRHWQQLLTLIGRLPESPEVLQLGIEALGHAIMGRARLGGTDEEVEALFAEGSELSQRLSDPSARARFLAQYGMSRTAAGCFAQAVPALEEALALVEETGDQDAEAAALYALSISVLCLGGDCQTALSLIDRGLAITEREPGSGSDVVGAPVATLWVVWKALALALMGRLEESEVAFERIASLSRKQQPLAAGIGDWAHNLMADLLGTPLAAMARGRRALEIAVGNPMAETLARHAYGMACLLSDRMQEAASNLEQALLSAREHGSYRFTEPMILVALSRALHGKGDSKAGLAFAVEAAALTQERGWLGADARIALAQILIHRAGMDDRERASAALDEAQRLVDEGGAASRQPFIHDARAAIAHAAGKEEEARRERGEAERLYAAMGVTPPNSSR